MIREFVVQITRHPSLGENDFVNAKPVAERRGDQLLALSDYDLAKLLPESQMRNFNINYNWSFLDTVSEVDALFPQGGLACVRFDPSNPEELRDNIKVDGTRQQTGYRIYYDFLREHGRLSTLEDAGIFIALGRHIVPTDELLHSRTVRFYHDAEGLEAHRFFVQFDNRWVGPFDVSYNGTSARYELLPELARRSYVLRGYDGDQLCMAPVGDLMLFVPGKDAKPLLLDAAKSAEPLLEGMRRALSAGSGAAKSASDIWHLVTHHAENPVFGADVPLRVREQRLARLQDLLQSSEQMETLLGDLGHQLLGRLSSGSDAEGWVNRYLEAHPEMLGSLAAVQAERKKYDKLRSDYSQLQERVRSLEDTVRANPVQEQRIGELERELEEANRKLAPQQVLDSISEQCRARQQQLEELDRQIGYKTMREQEVSAAAAAVETQFERIIRDKHAEMLRVEYDGFIARKVTEAAAGSMEEQANTARAERWRRLQACTPAAMPPEALVEYIVELVKSVRPTYDAPTILNPVVCLAQGFLTIFSGTAGCGKTSMSNILADVLGLNSIAAAAGFQGPEPFTSRYVPVSVEKGWSSKRDLLGYYNPLTRTFDENDRRLYEAMLQLNHESTHDSRQYPPFLILLDEANLSQMEYYWSDFMNVCDNPGSADITLGPDQICRIPGHLRFFATINNDDTTLPLSPRLVDRSWIVTLPHVYADSLAGDAIPPEKTRLVRWADLQEAFLPKPDECIMPEDIAELYETVRKKFAEAGLNVSARTDKAIRIYWGGASKSFRLAAPDEQADRSDLTALDFALSQRLLPKISGSGDGMEAWLTSLREICRKSGLEHSRDILDGILQRGADRMKYYTFFY